MGQVTANQQALVPQTPLCVPTALLTRSPLTVQYSTAHLSVLEL